MFFSLVNSETPVVELDALSALLLGDGEELVHVSGEGVLGGEEGGLGLEAVLVGGVAHFDGLALGGQEPADGERAFKSLGLRYGGFNIGVEYAN